MFDIDVMLGMLMGIRGQAAVYRTPYRAFVIEGFYGALLDRLEGSEGAGAGGRYYFHRTDGAGCNSVLIVREWEPTVTFVMSYGWSPQRWTWPGCGPLATGEPGNLA